MFSSLIFQFSTEFKTEGMENITQVHGITKEELFSKLQHIEEKLNLLSKTAQKPKK